MVAPGILSRRRLPGLLLLVPTVIAGVVALVAGLREHSDRPSDAALVAAVATVRSTITAQRVTADAGTTDAVIVIAPPWSMRPLVALGPLAAIAVPADGPWADLVAGRFARIFVIVEPDAEPWLRGRPLLASARTVGDDGAVSVLQIDSVAARFDMRARLNDATIRLHRSADAADVVVCSQRSRGINGGVRCAGQPSSLRVAREWALVTENGADVVVARPPPAGQRLEVAFGETQPVMLGAEIVVAAGHTRAGAERADPVKGVVRLAVVVDDQLLATIERRPSFVREPHRADAVAVFVNDTENGGRTVGLADTERGFRVDRLDTKRFAGTAHRLSFFIETDDDKNNDFAFDAFVPGGP